MYTGIIIHQNEIRTYSTCIWANMNIQNFIDVPLCRQCVVIDDVQIRFLLSANSRPHHNWTPAIAIMLCNTNFNKTFILHPPDPNLDSSVKRMAVQSLRAHVTWSGAHSKRSWTWCRVNGMRIAGRRDLKPASCNQFLMVCILKRTLVAFCNSLRNIVALLNRWCRACRAINQSWAQVVEHSRPPAFWCITFPVKWNWVNILEIMLWVTPRTRATYLCDNPASSIPMPLFISSLLRRRLTCWSAIPYVKFDQNLMITQAKPCFRYTCTWRQMAINQRFSRVGLFPCFSCKMYMSNQLLHYTFMRPEHRFTFSSNLIIYGDNMNNISDVKKVILSKLWVFELSGYTQQMTNF